MLISKRAINPIPRDYWIILNHNFQGFKNKMKSQLGKKKKSNTKSKQNIKNKLNELEKEKEARRGET